MMNEEAIALTFEADVEDSGNGTGAGGAGGQQQRIAFAPSNQSAVVETSAVGRHAYFRVRKLQRIAEAF